VLRVKEGIGNPDEAARLVNELKAAANRGEPDDGSRYCHHWQAAYRHTPHGKPVELP
jgi:hypothetical protein